MKKTLLAVALAVLLSVSAAVSQEQLQDLSQRYNSQVGELPSFLRSLVGDQKINLHVKSLNATFAVNVSAAKIQDIKRPGFKNPSLEIWISEKDLEAVSGSESPLNTTARLLKSGGIRYRSHGILNTLKLSLAKLLF
ncbi:MAG: hypothetical protein ABEJ98_02670 [Candidatus Nanohaloarchaea archaeon]